MKIIRTKIKDCLEIKLNLIGDKRGYFSRVFCQNELLKEKLKFKVVQINQSLSQKKGTLRGMHYQLPPFSEDKLVMCLSGKIYDVCLDLRKNSKTKNKWVSKVLDSAKQNLLLIPKGCAHGFLSLTPNTRIIYFVSNFYNSKKERGVRYNDPKFKIRWPIKINEISNKDKNWAISKKNK